MPTLEAGPASTASRSSARVAGSFGLSGATAGMDGATADMADCGSGEARVLLRFGVRLVHVRPLTAGTAHSRQ
jgi:hypothetical protein